MVWSFMQNARMYEALRDYGDRLDTVGIFTFEVDATGTLSETGTSISSMMTYINKWTHIHWMLTVMNHGTASIFTALQHNTNGAKDKFLTELVRIMEKYPWCAGVDIDLERGGGYENREAANSLFQAIYQTVKAYEFLQTRQYLPARQDRRSGQCGRGKLVRLCRPQPVLRHGFYYVLWNGVGRQRPRPRISPELVGGHLRLRGHGDVPGKDFHGPAGIRLELADIRHPGEPGRNLPGDFQHLLCRQALDDWRLQLYRGCARPSP